MHMAVAILRVEKGLDYSRILSEDKDKPIEEPRIIQMNDSTTDLLDNSQIHGSNESLSRNDSQGTNDNEIRESLSLDEMKSVLEHILNELSK